MPTWKHQIALWALQRALWRNNKQAAERYDEMDKAIAGGNIAEIARMLYLCWRELNDASAMLLKEGDHVMEQLSFALKQADNIFREEQGPKPHAV